jgi:hypothetical protein
MPIKAALRDIEPLAQRVDPQRVWSFVGKHSKSGFDPIIGR